MASGLVRTALECDNKKEEEREAVEVAGKPNVDDLVQCSAPMWDQRKEGIESCRDQFQWVLGFARICN
ncbi:hypothetical protein NC652_034773 [Populus alba x Populus x berolinensis]|nr:hypothetical protein NC652_034773 [Populus alba x Populus x berolinensis]